MADLNDALVRGSSRILGKLYCSGGISISGETTTGSLNVGASSASEAIIRLNGKNAISGYDTWLRINEGGFTSGIYCNTSILRTDGTLQVGSSGKYFNVTSAGVMTVAGATTLKSTLAVTGATTLTGRLTANGGLVATTGIMSQLTVTDVLRASEYDLQTVAQLGGAFYCSPTVRFPYNSSSAAVITKNSDGTVTIGITDSSLTTTNIAGAVWATGGKIKASGTLGGVTIGTCEGTISSINTTSHVLTIKISGGNSASLVAGTVTAANMDNFNVMLYNTGTYPVGILMNCYGTNSAAYIDIYGGSSATPVVRVGNLSGITTTINGSSRALSGWGIFTTNGYFEGVIESSSGVIGGWSLGSTSIYRGSNALGTSGNGNTYLGSSGFSLSNKLIYKTSDGSLVINGSGTFTGSVTATSGTIGGCTIVNGQLTANHLSSISSNMGTITAGLMKSDDYAYADEDVVLCDESGNVICNEDKNPILIDNGIPYSDSGMKISLTDAYIRTPTAFIGKDFAHLKVALNVEAGSTIAGFTIGSDRMYTNGHINYNSNVDGIYIGNDYISLGAGGMTYFNKNGSAKIGALSISTTGAINIGTSGITYFNANGTGKIGAFNFTNTYLANNTTSLAGAASSVYLGTSGISCGTTFRVTNAGALTASNASITGSINATTIRANTNYSIYTSTNSSMPVIRTNTLYSGGWYELNVGAVTNSSPYFSFSLNGGSPAILTKNADLITLNGTVSCPYFVCGRVVIYEDNLIVGDNEVSLVNHTHNNLLSVNSGLYGVQITSVGNFRAYDDGEVDLGTSSIKWKRVYATNATISTSDVNEKEFINNIDSRYEQLFMKLRPVNYMWKQQYDYDKHDRIHCGLIAQEVNQAAEEVGLSSKLFAAICRDELDTPTEDGRIERWGLAYGEFIGLNIHMTQKNTSEIEQLKSEIEILKNRIQELEGSMA